MFGFDIAALFLGYTTVVLSWIGYHQSIREKPIRMDTRAGFFRFIIDIGLLACYWLLLVKFENFWFVLLMLLVIYWVFVLWGRLKWEEYKSEDTPQYCRRRGVSTFWAIFFTAIFMVYWFAPNPYDLMFLIAAYIGTILYRLHKGYLRPQTILDVLAFTRPERKEVA